MFLLFFIFFHYVYFQVSLMSSDRKLFEGIMVNGTVEGEVPMEIAKLPDWKTPIVIGIVSGNPPSNILLGNEL